jgi:hypothetical protein
MNLRRGLCVVSLAHCTVAPSSLVLAQEALVGSWVLDPAGNKGTAAEMLPSGGTMEVTGAGDGKFKSLNEVTVGGVVVRSEITYAVDGKDYAVTATPAQPGVALTQSIERVGDGAYKSSIKINDQLFATATTEVSADGETLTQTTTGLGQFAALSSTVVYKRK